MGVGHGGQRPGAWLSQAVWLRHRAERSHPPDHAKGGRKYYLPHRNLHGLSATSTRHGPLPRTHEGASRAVAELAGINERPLRGGRAYPRHRRFILGVIQRVSLKYAKPISNRSVQKDEKSASKCISGNPACSVLQLLERQPHKGGRGRTDQFE